MQTGSPTLGARLPSGSHRMPEYASEPASQFGQVRSSGDDWYRAGWFCSHAYTRPCAPEALRSLRPFSNLTACIPLKRAHLPVKSGRSWILSPARWAC